MKVSSEALTLLCFIFSGVVITQGHPQCLDYYPPFRSSKPLDLCWDYKNYGCCTLSKDKSLLYDYKYAMKNLKSDKNSFWCREAIRKIVCAECHPYAAHVYDAEDPSMAKGSKFSKKEHNFPGLCRDFCHSVLESCRDGLLALPFRDEFSELIRNSSKEAFCKWAEPGDKDYCIPKASTSATNKVQEYSTSSENVIELCVKHVGQELRNPLVGVHSNDGTNRLFVGEQKGVIYIYQLDKNLHHMKRIEKPFFNITDKVLNSGYSWDERGFLGLAFHPNYATNGRFFVYYSAINEGNPPKQKDYGDQWYFTRYQHKIRISEFIVSTDDPNMANPNSEIILLEVDQPEPNHEGGMLMFGDDRYLYIFIGDGGGAGDVHGKYGNGLNMSTLLGKVLRINVDLLDGRLYSIPSDNPFITNKNAKPEIFAYGVRNIWRCSKDRGSRGSNAGKGRIFCGDVGQYKYEEIDIIIKGGNYGWRAKEGFACYDKKLCNSSLAGTQDRKFLFDQLQRKFGSGDGAFVP